MACIRENGPIVEYLIERCKFDPNEKNERGESPLFTAIKRDCFNIVKYLIEHVGVNIDITNNSGENALHEHIKSHYNIRMVQYFIEKVGININIQDSEGNTLLHVAYDSNRNLIARYLISKGIDKTIPNIFGQITLKKEIQYNRSRENAMGEGAALYEIMRKINEGIPYE